MNYIHVCNRAIEFRCHERPGCSLPNRSLGLTTRPADDLNTKQVAFEDDIGGKLQCQRRDFNSSAPVMSSIFKSIRARIESHRERDSHPSSIAPPIHNGPYRDLNDTKYLLPQSTSPPANRREKRTTLIELFQSQGCNSCPPTNSNLISLVQDQKCNPDSGNDYLLLTYHVTYWDYLGWVDVFGLSANDARQREYVRKLGLKSAYTPMVVVNGRGVGVGNPHADLKRVLSEGQKKADQRVKMSVVQQTGNGGVVVEVDTSNLSMPKPSTSSNSSVLEVLHVRYMPALQSVRIDRGENAGRILPHVNVVTGVEKIGYATGNERIRFSVGRGGEARENEASVLIVQDGRVGEVLGVLRIV